MKNRRFLLILVSTILLSFLLVELMWDYKIAFFTKSLEHDFPKAGDYLGFALLFLLPALLAFFLQEADNSAINKLESAFSNLQRKSYDLCMSLQPQAMLIFLGMFWIVCLGEHGFFENVTTGEYPFDPLHEGERVGYLQTFLNSNQPFKEMFVNLGFGMSVLGSLLGVKLLGFPHGLIGERFLFTLEGLLAWLGCIWILWQIAKFSFPDREIRLAAFAFASALFVMNGGSLTAPSAYFTTDFAQPLFIFQLCLVIHLLCEKTDSPATMRTWGIAFALGLSVPPGFFYSVKYGLLFLPVAAIAGLLALPRTFALAYWVGGLAGAAVSTGATLHYLGADQAATFVEGVLYWPKYWNFNLAIPLFTGANKFYFWIVQVLIVTQIMATIYLWQNFRNRATAKDFFREHSLLLFMLAVSLLFAKLILDRSDKHHFRQAALPSMFLAILLAFSWLKSLENNTRAVSGFFYRHKPMISLAIIGFMALNMHPKEAALHIKPYYKKYDMVDEKLIRPDYAQAIQEILPETQSSPCFFSMTSEGIWHYFFKKPSCTKILYPVCIIPEKEQIEAVTALETKKPMIILYSNDNAMRGGEKSVAASAPLMLYNYIHEHYEPHRKIASHWFWKRI